jgi:hypothetical protein
MKCARLRDPLSTHPTPSFRGLRYHDCTLPIDEEQEETSGGAVGSAEV